MPALPTMREAEMGIIHTASDAVKLDETAECRSCGRELPLYRIKTPEGLGPKVIPAHGGTSTNGFCSAGRNWRAK